MGDYADDYKYNYVEEYSPKRRQKLDPWLPKVVEFEVNIVHRKTLKCEWTGTVYAHSRKDAQAQFRKGYAHIRDKYTHEYALTINQL